MNQYGHGRGTMHGGFSEYSIVSEKYCYQMKRDISALEAVLLEPMGKDETFEILKFNPRSLEVGTQKTFLHFLTDLSLNRRTLVYVYNP